MINDHLAQLLPLFLGVMAVGIRMRREAKQLDAGIAKMTEFVDESMEVVRGRLLVEEEGPGADREFFHVSSTHAPRAPRSSRPRYCSTFAASSWFRWETCSHPSRRA